MNYIWNEKWIKFIDDDDANNDVVDDHASQCWCSWYIIKKNPKFSTLFLKM